MLRRLILNLPASWISFGRRSLLGVLAACDPPPPGAPPALETKHLREAELFVDRRAMVRALPQGAEAAEIGVDEGEFSASILSIARPSKLLLIDAWGGGRYSEAKHDAVQHRFASEIGDGRVRICRGRSINMLDQLEDASLDWAYLDTDHGYDMTRRELSILARKLKPEGLLCGHDYSIGNWDARIRYGVIEAVNEFCVREGWVFAGLTNEPGGMDSFALKREGASITLSRRSAS